MAKVNIFNRTDGVWANHEPIKKSKAKAWMKLWRQRFKDIQGYYSTRGQRISPDDVILEIVPVGKQPKL